VEECSPLRTRGAQSKAKNYAEFAEERRGAEAFDRKNPPFIPKSIGMAQRSLKTAKDGAPSSTWSGGVPEKTQDPGKKSNLGHPPSIRKKVK
jgi:hypothetical protein